MLIRKNGEKPFVETSVEQGYRAFPLISTFLLTGRRIHRWAIRRQTTHQPPWLDREQPIEAPQLARQLAQSGDPRLQSIRVNAFDPGMMPGTALARTYSTPFRFVWNYILPALTLFQKNVNRPVTSGRRLAALASGQMGELTGKYVSMGKVFPSSPLSQDASKAHDLWSASAEMTGLPASLNVPPAPLRAAL